MFLSFSCSDPGLGSYRYGHADGYDHRERDVNTDWYSSGSPRGYYDQRPSASEWESGNTHSRHHEGGAAWSGDKYPERDFYYQPHFSEPAYGSNYRRGGNAPPLSRGLSSGNTAYNASTDRWASRGEGYRDEFPSNIGASRSTTTLSGAHNTSNNSVSAMATNASTSEPRSTEGLSKSVPSVVIPSAPKPPSATVTHSAQAALASGTVQPLVSNAKPAVPPPVPPARLRVDSTASFGTANLSNNTGSMGHSASTAAGTTATMGSQPMAELGSAMDISSVRDPLRVKRAFSDGVVNDHRPHNMYSTQPLVQPSTQSAAHISSHAAHPATLMTTVHASRDDSNSAHIAKKAKHEGHHGDSNRHRKESTPVKKPVPVVVAPEPPVPVSTTSLFDTLSKFKSSAPTLTSTTSATQPYVSITGALSIETPSLLQSSLSAPLSGYKSMYNSTGLATPMKPGSIAPSGVAGAGGITVSTANASGSGMPVSTEDAASLVANPAVPTSAPSVIPTSTSNAEDNKRPRVAWGQGTFSANCLVNVIC